jgi:predicted fused transcriptional regulator/phosphomethylpyrimidine kinase
MSNMNRFQLDVKTDVETQDALFNIKVKTDAVKQLKANYSKALYEDRVKELEKEIRQEYKRIRKAMEEFSY